MKVLVTGANGFLGYYLVQQLLSRKYEVIATGKGECRLPFNDSLFQYVPMDFTDPFAVHDVFNHYKPGVVIHAGAMSKPDDCEKEQWQAWLVNVEATVTLLMNAEEHKSFFVFISTDFIFNGEKGMYREDDLPQPVNFYGKTKLEAEAAVKEYEHDWAIIRTVMVYGKPMAGRGNLLTITREKLEKGETYQVFDDQVRTPTYVEDLATGIVSVIEKRATGVFHISGTDILTPYQMACLTADHLGLDKSNLKKVTAIDMQQAARRPARTGFNIEKARNELGFEPVSFKEGLIKTFESDS